VRLAAVDELHHPLLELRGGVEVDLTAQLDHVGGVVDRLVLDMKVHRDRI
jgi:hypothetical protein